MLERRGYRDINNKEGDAPKFSGKKEQAQSRKHVVPPAFCLMVLRQH
jgi:hypothetical protein